MMMEAYRKTIQHRIIIAMIPMAGAILLGIYNVFFASTDMQDSFVFGFQCGAVSGLAIVSIFMIIRYRKLLKSDRKLRLEYNREHDERILAVRAKAGLPVILYTSIVMIFAGVVAGYYNDMAFMVLVVAAICQLVFASVLKIYYSTRM